MTDRKQTVPGDQLVVKRYANRKLYDSANRSYVTLGRIRELIRDGVDVRVVDHATGEDLTTRIYAQILYDLEKEQQGSLPEQLLGGMIRAGEQGLTHFREKLMGGEDLAGHVEREIAARLHTLETHELLSPEAAAELQDLLLVHSQRLRILEAREYNRDRREETALQSLRMQLDELEKRLEGLGEPVQSNDNVTQV